MTQHRHKTMALRQKAAGAPSEAQLAAIRVYTLRDFTADELVVREFALAHNCIDRDKECFDEPLLADFADTLPGKGVFIKHPTSWQGDGGPGEGRVFDAHLEQMSLEAAKALLREPKLQLPPDRTTVSVLLTSAYFAKTPENEAFLIKQDAGIVSDVSVGFSASERNRLKGPDGIELNAWRWVGPGEAHEMSLVWLGAQPGARATKGAPRNNEDSDMELQEQLNAAKARNTELENQLSELRGKSAGNDGDTAKLAALKTGLGDNAVLLDDTAKLASLVLAGNAHRKSMIDRLVAADRVAGDVADDEAAVKAAGDDYDAMPTAVLERLVKRAIGAEEAPRGAIGGGDPNAPKPKAATKAAGDSVFNNPLIGGAAAATA